METTDINSPLLLASFSNRGQVQNHVKENSFSCSWFYTWHRFERRPKAIGKFAIKVVLACNWNKTDFTCLRKFLHRLITNVFFSAFVLERGRVVLRLSTTDVQCKTVSFKPDSFQSNESRINVQTSINYFNSTGSFVHDAAVTWVESVTFTSFKVCALKAGRAERLTPDSGVTFVDYIAFQESPAGAVSSQLSMPLKWWDGTTCKTVTFQNVSHKNSYLPYNITYIPLEKYHAIVRFK